MSLSDNALAALPALCELDCSRLSAAVNVADLAGWSSLLLDQHDSGENDGSRELVRRGVLHLDGERLLTLDELIRARIPAQASSEEFCATLRLCTSLRRNPTVVETANAPFAAPARVDSPMPVIGHASATAAEAMLVDAPGSDRSTAAPLQFSVRPVALNDAPTLESAFSLQFDQGMLASTTGDAIPSVYSGGRARFEALARAASASLVQRLRAEYGAHAEVCRSAS